MKPSDSIYRGDAQLFIAADNLLSFMAKMDSLDDSQSQQLAEWLKARETEALTNAEKHFLLAARAYVLDYPSELNEVAP